MRWLGSACGICMALLASVAQAAAPALTLSLEASLSPGAARLLSGTSSQVTATLSPGNASIDVTRTVRRWQSSAPGVARVDATGRVSALSSGTATISAEISPAVTGELQLTVTSLQAPLFSTPPTDTLVSRHISPAVRVLLRDDLGDPIGGLQLTLSIGEKPAPGTLSGTLARTTAANGTAEFADLAIDWLGSGYTLVAEVVAPGGARLRSSSTPFDELRVGDPCLGPQPACDAGCPDSDSDGLNDAWETAHGVDINGDGIIDPARDLVLAGADPLRPDIYLEYDYMGWGEPGAVCTQDSDCTAGGTQPNYRCHQQRCNHNHRPDPRSIQIVVDAFARRGVTLHVDPAPDEVPHSLVATFARASDDGPGPRAICAGADIEAGMLGGPAVSHFDIKKRFSDPRRAIAYHYALLAHFNTCLTDDPGATLGNCNQCPTDRAMPSGSPVAGGSGVAELPGNDLIVSLGASLFGPIASVPRNHVMEAGVLMHELGHNLGLHHAGDVPSPESAPNYLSVMNPRYVLTGIIQSTGPGSTNLVACTTDTDCPYGGTCRPILPAGGRCSRVDYSTSTLATLEELRLDETAGLSPLGSGPSDIVLYNDAAGFPRRGAAAGPVDWDGDGMIAAEPVSVDLNGQAFGEVMRGYDDWDHGACTTSNDCPVNAIRRLIHELVDPRVDPREQCVRNRCQPQWHAFQCTRWGSRD